MDEKLKEFIYSQSSFNDCTFCKLYGLNKNCPVKYTEEEIKDYPDKKKVEENYNKCKDYVINNLYELMKK